MVSSKILKWFPLTTTLLVLLFAIIELYAWKAGLFFIISPFSDFPAVSPTSALVLLILSLCILLQQTITHIITDNLSRLLALLVLLLSFTMLASHFYPDLKLPLEALLKIIGLTQFSTLISSPQTSLLITLFSSGLFFTSFNQRITNTMGEWLLLIVLVLLVIVFLGYAQQQPFFYVHKQGIGISLLTVTALSLLGWSWLFVQHDGFLSHILTRESYGGELMRWIVLVSAIFPLIVAWGPRFVELEALSQVEVQVLLAAVVFMLIILSTRYLALRLDHQEREHRKTEKKLRRLQLDLLHMNRISTMGEMASGIAHELNQPLSAIKNYAAAGRNISKQTTSNDRIIILLDRIKEQADRSFSVINSIHSIAQKKPPAKKRTDIATLLTEIQQFPLYHLSPLLKAEQKYSS